jgi:hypothetical protein
MLSEQIIFVPGKPTHVVVMNQSTGKPMVIKIRPIVKPK